jgi:hypothetical protein
VWIVGVAADILKRMADKADAPAEERKRLSAQLLQAIRDKDFMSDPLWAQLVHVASAYAA